MGKKDFLTSANNNQSYYIMTENKETSYKDRLIDETFPLVDRLLEKYGEFFPLAAAVLQDDSLASVATYDGDEKPKSDTVIADLKEAIKKGFINGEYKAAVIFYDVYAVNPSTNIKSDAVARAYNSTYIIMTINRNRVN